MKTKNIIYLSILLTFILLGACVKEIEVFTGNIVGKIILITIIIGLMNKNHILVKLEKRNVYQKGKITQEQ